MIGDVDVNGIAVLVAAIGTALAAVLGAVFAGLAALKGNKNANAIEAVHEAVRTNGDSRSLGEIASDVGRAVAPDPQPRPPAGD